MFASSTVSPAQELAQHKAHTGPTLALGWLFDVWYLPRSLGSGEVRKDMGEDVRGGGKELF